MHGWRQGSWSVTGVLIIVFAISAPGGSAQPEAPGRSDEARDDATAVASCNAHRARPPRALRQAIIRVSERRLCAATDGLGRVVVDDRLDPITRGLAALAMGEVGCRPPARAAHLGAGLSDFAQGALLSALSAGQPEVLRQAAVRATGRAGVAAAIPTLTFLRDGESPVLRLLAAQALTRITGADHLDELLRDEAIEDALTLAADYQIVDAEPAP